VRRLVPAALLAGLALGGCSADPQERYCEAVEEHQAELTDVAASDDPAAVFDALDAYDALAEDAPRDIADDWAAVVDPLRALEQALAEHDVDPSDYDAESPPSGLDEGALAEIEAAARAVGSEQTVRAMAAVEQHALDVCGTPLSR
jgi:hypothetical protein